MSPFAGVATQTTVVALEPTTLWRIARPQLLGLIAQHPALANAMIGSLASRVIHLANLVEDLALRPVEARLARLFLAQARDGQIERRRWATQAELAAQIGTVPDVLNRTLRALVDAGLITVGRRTIRILDQAGLEERAQIS
jgi:CRP-like cAMP-binding protein